MDKKKIIADCEADIVAVEFSNIDAHKKANIKAVLYGVMQLCEQCKLQDQCCNCKYQIVVNRRKHG
jgi:hypothetical protein